MLSAVNRYITVTNIFSISQMTWALQRGLLTLQPELERDQNGHSIWTYRVKYRVRE